MITISHTRLKQFFLFLLLLIGSSLFAQVEVNHQAGWFYIPDSLSIHIKGSLNSLEGNNELPLLNEGKMYISDSISCYGENKIFGDEPDTVTADIFLNGDSLQIVSGDKDIRFGNLFIQNSYDTVELRNNVDIYNKIQLDSGNVYVHDFMTLDLLSSGLLIGERNDSRIFGGNYGEMKLTKPLIFGKTYSDIGGIGFGLTVNGNLGTSTEITRKNVSQLNVSNGSIERFYSFKPENNAFVSKPKIHYLDTIELNENGEELLEFFVSSSEGNTWTRLGGEVDTVLDVVQSTSTIPFVLTDKSMLSLAEAFCDNSPFLQFEVDTIPLCGGSAAWLHPEGITGMSSVWSNGKENADSIQVDSEGVYYVTITNVMGCSSTDSVVVIWAPVPEVSFTVDPVCVGSVSEFENETKIASGDITYRWELGDLYTDEEDTSTVINPEITYQNQGVFQVKLTVESNYGCVSESVEMARVNAYPTVDFAVINDCADSLVHIDNLTTVLPDTTITYAWDFGDEQSSTDSLPMHHYASAGSYQIELTANSLGCESVITKDITIHPNPVASFIAEGVCLGEPLEFTNQSTVPSTDNAYLWQFDDENTAVISDPNYAFENAGDYTVSLTATTNNGCAHDTSIQVSVFALPRPEFTAQESCEGKEMLFTNTSESSSDFNWDFNEEGSSDEFEPEFIFSTYGDKQVLLTETDSNACVTTITKELAVKAMPNVDFISIDGCQGEELKFLNKSITPEGDMDYSWSIDNEQIDNSTNFLNTFDQAGDYTVKLLANNDGCVDSLESITTVYAAPVLDLGGDISTCANEYVLDALNEGSNYVWSDASTNQQLTAVSDGTYTVKVTTNNGCAIEDTVLVDLLSVVSPQLGDDATFCDNTELDAGYPGATYLWSTGETTQHITVSTSGTYSVEVIDQNGCVGSDTILITIVQSVVPDLGSDLTACAGEILTLESGSDMYNYKWNTAETSSSIAVSTTGTFWCELTDNNGCISRDSVAVLVYDNPELDLGADTHYCDSVLFDISGTNVSYSWDNGLTSGDRVIFESGKYWAQVSDDITGCISRDTVNLTLSSSPEVDLGFDSYLCNGSTMELDAGNLGSTFNWNVGASTSSIIAAASGDYSVEVTSLEGCVGSDTVTVTIDDPLNTYLGEDFVLCQGAAIEINSPIADAASYEWHLEDSVFYTNEPTVIVEQQGALSVIVYTAKGCTASDTIKILESGINLQASYLAPTSNIYVGDTIQFINLSQPEPYTSYWDYGDGYFTSQDSPEHIYYFTGEYKAMLEVDNGVCTDTISKIIEVQAQRPLEDDVVYPSEMNEIVSVSAYPNPTSDLLNLDVSLAYDDDIIIECFNVYGMFVFTDLQNGSIINTNYGVSDYLPGIYFLRVRIPDQTVYIKFIKK